MHEQGCQSSLKSEQWESTLGLLREKGTLTMDELNPLKGLKLETPANYRIRVQGHLDDIWADQLSGMVITKAFTANKQPMTILVGHLADQAALTRVLNTLYELHLSLISVENLDDKSSN